MFCAFTLSGCAGNIIPLSYPELHKTASPVTANGISVCIVDLENKRDGNAIGQRQDGTPILPRTPVERWMATGLAAELSNAGHTVILAETLPEALQKGAAYIVTGEVEEVWLAESSFTRYTGTIRASISLLDANGERITKNGYNSVYSKTVLPIYGVPQTLLDEALAEILHPAAVLLHKMMQ